MILTEGKTDREVFEEIAAALVAQGGRCMNEGSISCLYGNGEGMHCAVGWLLPEDDKELMNLRGGVSTLLELLEDRSIGPNEEWIAEHLHMLVIAQDIHDYKGYASFDRERRINPVEEWNSSYQDLAGIWDDWLALRIEQEQNEE